MRSYMYIGLGIAAIVAVGLWSLIRHPWSDPVPIYTPAENLQYSYMVPFWEGQVRTYGGTVAYQRFSYAVQDLNDGEKHIYAHFFGEALYDAEGDAGFGVCDTQFQSGCYHQFLGMAFSQQGIPILGQFAEKCIAIDTQGVPGCSHGLGHAILLLVGYTRTDLSKALPLCDQYFHSEDYPGCVGGVMMEYDIRDITSNGVESAATARPLTDDNRYSPCLSLPEKYQSICVHELPQWWSIASPYGTSTAAAISRLGTWCEALQGTLYDACIQGIGYMLPSMTSRPDLLLQLCWDATHSDDAKLSCLYEVARQHYMDYPKEGLLCDSFELTATQLPECENYATFGNYKTLQP